MLACTFILILNDVCMYQVNSQNFINIISIFHSIVLFRSILRSMSLSIATELLILYNSFEQSLREIASSRTSTVNVNAFLSLCLLLNHNTCDSPTMVCCIFVRSLPHQRLYINKNLVILFLFTIFLAMELESAQ